MHSSLAGRPSLSPLFQHPLLKGAKPSTIAMLNSNMRRTEWRASQVLFHRGDPPVGLILILEGSVRVIRELNGRRYVLHTEGAGGALGEVPLFDHATMPATAIAVERTLGGRIPSEVVHRAIEDDTLLAARLLERLARRARHLADRLERLTLFSVGKRIAASLLELSERSTNGEITLGMTQEQFAEELGTVREVLVREIGTLVRDGTLLSIGRGRFRLQNPFALRAQASAK
jgi:CRP-like cAMP-binding protein